MKEIKKFDTLIPKIIKWALINCILWGWLWGTCFLVFKKYHVYLNLALGIEIMTIILLTIFIILGLYTFSFSLKIHSSIKYDSPNWIHIKCKVNKIDLNGFYDCYINKKKNEKFKILKHKKMFYFIKLIFILIIIYILIFVWIDLFLGEIINNIRLINFITNTISIIIGLITGSISGKWINEIMKNNEEIENEFQNFKNKLLQFNSFIKKNSQNLNESNYLSLSFLPNFFYGLNYKDKENINIIVLDLKRYFNQFYLIKEFLVIKYLFFLLKNENGIFKQKYLKSIKHQLHELILLIFEDEEASYLKPILDFEKINRSYSQFVFKMNVIRKKWGTQKILIFLQKNNLNLKSKLTLTNFEFDNLYFDLHYFQLMYLEYFFTII
ncbi:hypothetical protein [Spiroplasma attinicola]|uniref:hypothetical protein n=1 Tax=Spiroplasma attinicola TaxID=2904537 RepID=UPI002022ACF5|nr:hypothetical protein [Spiroplasma sp. JKS002670]MCL8209903.1 hypothetical protein [Spiroplasma sp. JKS002670]